MDADYLILKLGLEKHPEGGYFREVYRSSELISDNELSFGFEGKRHLSTSIYFLLESGDISRFHRLKSDELWYYHGGSSLTLYVIDKNGELKTADLGLDIESGEQPQVIIPGGCIFGAAVKEIDSYCLVGCMVTPGFDFSDFELLSPDVLMRKYPKHESVIRMLT